MKIIFTKEEKNILQKISHYTQELNIESYIIGGFVRDKILQRPSKDIDIVCDEKATELAELLSQKLPNCTHVAIYKNFGTAQIKVDGFEIEFVAARKESYTHTSRKPEVTQGNFDDDMRRRDFTINALACALGGIEEDSIIDTFDGLRDIENKLIRTPLDPDITFSDDPLRMMRAIRFATQLQFQIEEKTLLGIQRNASRIKIISQERITDELNKILLSPKPSIGFALLMDTGILPYIFPELQDLQGVDKIGKWSHKDNFYHTLEVLDNVSNQNADLWLRWAALLHDIAKPPTKRFDPEFGFTFHGHEALGAKWVKRIFTRMKLPLHENFKKVEKLVLLHLRPIALTKEEITDSAVRRLIFEAGDDLEDLMTLCEADITSKNEVKVKRYLQNFELVRQKMKEVEERDHVRNFQPPITGIEIMTMYDLKPSKTVGILKDKIKDAILDGEIKNDLHEATILLHQEAEKLGLQKKV